MKSDLHKNLQEAVKDYYQQKGWIAIIEHYISGKKIDVLTQDIKTKTTIACEIQLTVKHCLENIKLDFKVGCDEVHIIAPDKKVLEQMKKASEKLDKNILNKVNFFHTDEFIPQITNKKNKKNRAEFNRNLITE